MPQHKMIVKKHFTQGKLILAVCDSDIINKKFEDEKAVLDLASSFYKGEETSAEDFIDLMKKAYIINADGKETIALMIKEKVISESGKKKIKDVPYAQVVFESKRD